jgi:hypothetical protein
MLALSVLPVIADSACLAEVPEPAAAEGRHQAGDINVLIDLTL